LCYFIKETAYFALPVFGLALIFSIFSGRLRWAAWTISIVGVAIGAATTLDWGDAAYWYRSTAQAAHTRVQSPENGLGNFALQLETSAATTPEWLVPLFQPVPELTGSQLQGKGYTLGVWMWADTPIETHTPVLHDGKQVYFETVSLGTEPAFYSFEIILSREAFHRVWVSLTPPRTGPDQNVVIYYDGMVLARGEHADAGPPSFDSPDGSSGVWSGEGFQNLLRNGSGELAGPRVQPWADRLGAKFTPDQTRPSLVITYLLDWRGAGIYYRAAADRLFSTFWGAFGWGHVPLAGQYTYRILLLLTAVGLAAAAVVLLRKRWMVIPEALLLLGLTLLLVWGMTFVRGAIYLALPNPYFPVARYAYTAIIPTVLLISLGWWEILSRATRRLHFPEWANKRLYLVFLIGLDLLAVYSILRFYQG
jgi:hypothetical protein